MHTFSDVPDMLSAFVQRGGLDLCDRDASRYAQETEIGLLATLHFYLQSFGNHDLCVCKGNIKIQKICAAFHSLLD